MGKKVLVVDDEKCVNDMVRELLSDAGYCVVEAQNGKDGLRRFYSDRPDLALVDVMMPEMDGIQLCQRIREVSGIPIIILSAKGQESDRVLGLTVGADDYLVKPVGSREIVARVEAALRRAIAARTVEPPSVYADGEVIVDFPRYEVTVRGAQVSLTRLEFRLLSHLVRHPSQVLTHDQILDHVWGQEYAATEGVKWLVGHLRQKIEADIESPKRVVTVRGIGYRYDPPRHERIAMPA